MLKNASSVQETRFPWLKHGRIMMMKGTIFFPCMLIDSRMSPSAWRKSRPRPIIVTPLASSHHFTCSNTSHSKFRCALFSISDSQNPTALRNAIKLAPERQRMIVVRASGKSWKNLLNLDSSIVRLDQLWGDAENVGVGLRSLRLNIRTRCGAYRDENSDEVLNMTEEPQLEKAKSGCDFWVGLPCQIGDPKFLIDYL